MEIMNYLFTLIFLSSFITASAEINDSVKSKGFKVDTLFALTEDNFNVKHLKDIHVLADKNIYLFVNEKSTHCSKLFEYDTSGKVLNTSIFPFEINAVEWNSIGHILLNSHDSIIHTYNNVSRKLNKKTELYSFKNWYILIDSNYLSYFEQNHLSKCEDRFNFFIDENKNVYQSNENYFLRFSYPSYISYPNDIFISYTGEVLADRTKIIDVNDGKLIHYSGWYNLFSENLESHHNNILYSVPESERFNKKYFWKFSKFRQSHNLIGLVEIEGKKMLLRLQ